MKIPTHILGEIHIKIIKSSIQWWYEASFWLGVIHPQKNQPHLVSAISSLTAFPNSDVHPMVYTPGKINTYNMRIRGPPWKRKPTSSKPSFSGAMLIFGGVSVLFAAYNALQTCPMTRGWVCHSITVQELCYGDPWRYGYRCRRWWIDTHVPETTAPWTTLELFFGVTWWLILAQDFSWNGTKNIKKVQGIPSRGNKRTFSSWWRAEPKFRFAYP